MRFAAEQQGLAEALATAQRAVGSRSASGAMSGLRVRTAGDSVEITGTNLDLTISATTPATVRDEGAFVAPARLLTDIVRAMEPGRIEVSLAAELINIHGGRSAFEVPTIAAEEFPNISLPVGEPATCSAKDLAAALRQVVPSASHDELRQVLTGVLFERSEAGLRLVATDSYRLAVRDVDALVLPGGADKVLMSSKALAELLRVLGSGETVELLLGEREVCFTVGGVVVASRLIDGEFPNYRQLLPQSYPNVLAAKKDAILGALRRLKPVAENTPIKLVLDNAATRLEVASPDRGRADEEIEASYQGATLTVAFNPEYLAAGVDAVDGDDVLLETIDPLKPAVIRAPLSSEFQYLLMPVRVS